MPKKPRKTKAEPVDKADTGNNEKKLSCADAALKVLAESIQPLNAKQIIEATESKGYCVGDAVQLKEPKH